MFMSPTRTFRATCAPASRQTRATACSSGRAREARKPEVAQAERWSPSWSRRPWQEHVRGAQGKGRRRRRSSSTRSGTTTAGDVGNAVRARAAWGPACELLRPASLELRVSSAFAALGNFQRGSVNHRRAGLRVSRACQGGHKRGVAAQGPAMARRATHDEVEPASVFCSDAGGGGVGEPLLRNWFRPHRLSSKGKCCRNRRSSDMRSSAQWRTKSGCPMGVPRTTTPLSAGGLLPRQTASPSSETPGGGGPSAAA